MWHGANVREEEKRKKKMEIMKSMSIKRK